MITRHLIITLLQVVVGDYKTFDYNTPGPLQVVVGDYKTFDYNTPSGCGR